MRLSAAAPDGRTQYIEESAAIQDGAGIPGRSLTSPHDGAILETEERDMRGRLVDLLPAVLSCLALGCPSPVIPSVPLEELLSAPLEIEVAGRIFTLETDLWRDFMPVSPPDGSDLRAVVRITAVDLQPFPPELDADRLWVINGRNVWETAFSGENRPPDGLHPHQLEKLARGGPKWETGIRVEVVVRVVARTGLSYLLRAADQPIHRTD